MIIQVLKQIFTKNRVRYIIYSRKGLIFQPIRSEKNSAFSLLIGLNLKPLPKNTVLYNIEQTQTRQTSDPCPEGTYKSNLEGYCETCGPRRESNSDKTACGEKV